MSAMTFPRPARDNRLLVIDRASRTWRDAAIAELAQLFGPGDVLVVNDAGTLPASMDARVGDQTLELRLAEAPDADGTAWTVLFGPGSWRDDTDLRLAPPPVATGDELQLPAGHVATVVKVSPLSPRLVRLVLPSEALWGHGAPVQYSYLERDLELHEVQTSYAGRPWAVEMPSAGRPLDQALRDALEARGVRVVALTHGAGLSATGDVDLDRALPLPERYDVPPATWRAVQAADRVVAIGTSVVRALESAARGRLSGTTTLTLGPDTELRVVDALLSGMHEPEEPHFRMMAAFADRPLLIAAHRHAVADGYRNHEFGDSTLLL